MNTKIATAAAAAALLIGWAAAAGANHAQAAQEAAEARRAEAEASVALCTTINGRWGTAPNGAPRCEPDATVRTTATSADECRKAGGSPRKESGVQLCDHQK